jgi:hypothetical protein
MFVWFLQKKGFLNHPRGAGTGDYDYLDKKLEQSKQRGKDRFYKEFLTALFFEAFAKPEADRSAEASRICGHIPYLNGGLFLEHLLELDDDKALRIGKSLDVPDIAFENLFALFRKYEWSLNDTPGGKADEINPDVLGYIFERYINVVSTHSQKDLGAYYTRPEITSYLAERAIEAAVLERINAPAMPELGLRAIDFASVPELLTRMDDGTALKLLKETLPGLKILDPAVGSGAFLVAGMKVLINIYSAIVGRAELAGSPDLRAWLVREKAAHHNIGYAIRRRIITDNLYGVDLLEGAAEIAKLRLFLALVASAKTVDDLEPLPNIDFNLLRGNSLIGMVRVDAEDYERYGHKQLSLLSTPFAKVLEDYQRDVSHYRHSSEGALRGTDLRHLRDRIETRAAETNEKLNELLRDEFIELGVKYERATWNDAKADLGKPTKHAVEYEHIDALRPFHWGLSFGDIMHGGFDAKGGGFDIILTNPPWEVFKPQGKEFFSEHLPELGKNKTLLAEFEKDKSKLLSKNKAVREKYLEYESEFPHVNQYFRAAPEYRHQTTVIDGRKVGSDLNLYKLFLERCFHLLRVGGHCGIVVPSSIYTDLGAKGLRELLFAQTRIEGLFGFENRKAIFDGVHRSFKFVVLTFEKAAPPRVQAIGERNTSAPPNDLFSPASKPATERFPAAFMRLDVEDLARFPGQGSIEISLELVRKLSPDSLSLMEFKSQTDIVIAEKMLRFPVLGERVTHGWNFELNREFHMTDDAKALPFYTSPAKGRLRLYEGKMIWQYEHELSTARFWIEEKTGRSALEASMRRRIKDALHAAHHFDKARLDAAASNVAFSHDYEHYRLGFRDIAASTNERTMVCTILPRRVFAGNTINLQTPTRFERTDDSCRQVASMDECTKLALSCILNSFTLDWMVRQKITSHLNMFYVYQLPVPRIDAKLSAFKRLVRRAARLVCTTPEFNDLAREAGLAGHEEAATSEVERAQLRAEIDGLVGHLYGLTEEEFIHILGAFPLVRDPAKVAARNAFRDVERDLLND